MNPQTLFEGECEFVAGAATLDAIPNFSHHIKEIAFIGRSNVGKSSLINALTGRNGLARTSQTPGRTQQLNFFLLANKLMLVDMPGYGFAKVSKKQREEWDHLISGYLSGRPTLKRTLVLIDSRRGVMDTDEEMMEILDEAAASYQIVLTKVDQLKPQELEDLTAKTAAIIAKHPAAHPEIAATSSEKNLGLMDLRKALACLI